MTLSLIIIAGCAAVLLFLTRFVEIAFVSVEYDDIKDIVLGNRFIKTMFLQWFKHANILLASLQFIRFAIEVSAICIAWQHENIYSVIIVFVFIIVIGEYVPRTLAMQKGIRHTYYIIVPLYYFCLIISPIIRLLMLPADLIIKMFGGTMVINIPYLTKIEEQVLTNVLTEESDKQESEMLASVLEFKETIVREIMIPRIDIIAISADCTWEELNTIIQENGHSRMPVYDDRLDNLIGVLYVKDLIGIDPKKITIRSILHEPYFVPETKKINLLLRDFQSKHVHMAFVVDEYGGLVGLATIEDVLEEIVGEIEDEYDEEEAMFTRINDKQFIVSPKMTLDEFSDVFHIDIHHYITDDDETFETIAGFIISLLGNLPRKGYEHAFDDFKLRVLDVDKRRIIKIMLTLNAPLDKGEK